MWLAAQFLRTSFLRNVLLTLLQVLGLTCIAIGGNALSSAIHSPIPGSIFGFAFVFLLLKTGILPLSWVLQGANLLLGELLLFFIPSAVGVVQYPALVRLHGLTLYAVIVLSTTLVMTVTGLISEQLLRRKQGIRRVSERERAER